VKGHALLDLHCNVPVFIRILDGKVNDVDSQPAKTALRGAARLRRGQED
jgi:hypothetical protein